MPSSTTFDDADTSPRGFQYLGTHWGLGESIPQHYKQSAHYTNSSGDQVLLFFRGTSVTYFADRQPSLGLAGVSVDGLPEEIVNLTSSTAQYQQPVWSKNMTDGDHQLVIKHVGQPGTSIMLDYVTVVSNGNPTSMSSGPAAAKVPGPAILIDNTDPRIRYSSGWQPLTEGLFYNQSGHVNQDNGSLRLTFNGTAIWYFADTSPDHGNVRIQISDSTGKEIDGGDLISGYSTLKLAQQLVWSRTDLKAGTFTVNITHDDLPGKYASLDFFRYLPSAGSESTGAQPGKVGIIVVTVLAGLFGLGILYCVCVCLLTRRRRSRGDGYVEDESAPLPPQRSRSRSSSSSSTNAYYPYVDAPKRDPTALGGSIPMSQLMPSSRTGSRYPATFRSENEEKKSLVGPTNVEVHQVNIKPSALKGESVANSDSDSEEELAEYDNLIGREGK